jgi:hypothetical protein
MATTPVHELIPVLQIAIGPVILISGIGLLLLTLTNRFGRAVDRSRQLAREMKGLVATDQQRVAKQVEILYRRAGLIRLAIVMATVSVLLDSVLIIVLFLAALLKVEAGLLIILIFVTGIGSLIVALIAFIKEIHLSLQALKLEIEFRNP